MLLSCATQSMIRYLLFRKLIRLAYQTSDLISVPNLSEDIASDWLITNLNTVYTLPSSSLTYFGCYPSPSRG